jgi:hypothetical protein
LPPSPFTSAINNISLSLFTKLIEDDIYIYNVHVINYVNLNLHFTNVRIVVILLVITENITSWVSFYFRTSTFEKSAISLVSFPMCTLFDIKYAMGNWNITSLQIYRNVYYIFPPTPSLPPDFWWVRVGHLFSFLCCGNFVITLIISFVFVLCLVYIVLLVCLDCPFLITPSVFASIYLV